MAVDVVILAAGKGTRMKSALPKVLHPIAGRPMLQHVIDTVNTLPDINLHVVIGHGAEAVRETINGDINWLMQEEQLGTGHAVAQALPAVTAGNKLMVLYGDVPLIQTHTLEAMLDNVGSNDFALLTVDLENPQGYGRIVRDKNGDVIAIVEQKDANSEQLVINEVNTGVMAGMADDFLCWLPELNNENAQGEYYLTDVIAMACDEGKTINTPQPQHEWEVLGVNNRSQQAELERIYQGEQAQRLMENGLTILDPARIDIRGELIVGNDVVIDINAVFEGHVELKDGVRIGPNCCIKNSTVGEYTEIHANSILEDSLVAESCQIGPFARLRPNTELKANAKVGNFVETKKTTVGEGSKINHLSYVGDAILGKNVNVGAGTITCNYDGVNKFKTEIGDEAFIGSNTSLVAPVKVGEKGTVGAGSTITSEVGNEDLAVARGKQRNISGWKRPVKK